jgi:hypothetical protein
VNLLVPADETKVVLPSDSRVTTVVGGVVATSRMDALLNMTTLLRASMDKVSGRVSEPSGVAGGRDSRQVQRPEILPTVGIGDEDD